MRERSIIEQEAKRVCRDEIKQYVSDFLKIVTETKTNRSISENLKKYVEAIMYSLSGNPFGVYIVLDIIPLIIRRRRAVDYHK